MLLVTLILTSLGATEPIVGFSRLWVTPAKFTATVEPVRASEGRGTLTITNVHTIRSSVTISGHDVGELGPRAEATLTNVAAGTYIVTFTTPEGFRRTNRILTD